MPCTAKKDEAARAKLLREGESSPDTDLVLTVRELARLFERGGVDVLSLEPVPFDTPFMTEASGAAQLFATTGGVMEAALRTVAALTGGKAPANLVFEPVRGLANTKEATLETERFGAIRVAVVYGIRHVEPLLEMVRRGVSPYHFVEVMACPGGCIGGGGTAQGRWRASLPVRQKVVYRIDGELPFSARTRTRTSSGFTRNSSASPGATRRTRSCTAATKTGTSSARRRPSQSSRSA